MLTWFTWHDAAEDAPPTRDAQGNVIRYGGETVLLVGPWWVLTFEQALQYRRMHLEDQARAVEQFGEQARNVPESWLPLASTMGAGELCIDTAAPGLAPLWIDEPETHSERTSPQFTSLIEFADALTRVLEEGLVIPHPHDERAPMVDYPRLPAELRRLALW